MAKFYYGLDVNKSLGQLENPRQALLNLGLNPDDLDVIRGLAAANVTSSDIRNISGLDFDFKDELIKIYYGTNTYTTVMQEQKTIFDDIPGNIQMNSQLGASAIKYKYIDFENSTIKYADISTSRVSSWSSFDAAPIATSPIFYGGKLSVTPVPPSVPPDPLTGSSVINITGLNKTSNLKKRRFASEVPTHKIKINVNGSDMQFYAMRGIPVTFDAYYKNAVMILKVRTPVANYPSPTLLITNADDNKEKIYTLGTNANISTIRHYDTTSRPRTIQYYYDPRYMQQLYLKNLNITTFPVVEMSDMSVIDISFNDFRQLPNFKSIAPNLIQLDISGNNLSRSVYTGNYQLNNFLDKTKLEILDISGCFSDTTDIDLSGFTNLKTIRHSAGYGQENYRKMTSVGNTHKVTENIETYIVRGHDYRMVDESVKTSTKLRNIDISNNNIIDTNVYFDSTVLVTFRSELSNRHNVVDVSEKTSLTEYYYRYSGNLSAVDRTVDGKFDGCSNLNKIDLYACNATGNIGTAFKDLKELTFLDVRYTALSGKITDDSFEGTTKLKNLYIAGGAYDTTISGPFISTDGISKLTDLQQLYIYGNYKITGPFPSISSLKKLDILYIENTGFSGLAPSLSTQEVIRIAVLRNNKFTGYMPAITNDTLIDLRMDSNLLESNQTSQFPFLQCRSMRNLVLFGNKFGGPITTFEGCPKLRQIDLSRNNFNSYNKGSLANNRFLSNINISNNQLDKNSIFVFILDMLENWKSNNRTGVTINFLGNIYNSSDIEDNKEVKDALTFLLNQKWNIIGV